MPFVDEQTQGLGSVARLPQPAPDTPAPSLGETAGAALRTNNVGFSVYDAVAHEPSPKPNHPAFDPVASVPTGYEKYANRFLDSTSPEDTQWIKNKIDTELQDRQTISRSGKLGFVASLAAGLTDPVTLASMFIPGGAETRLAQAGRMAAINAGTSAVQEGIEHEFSPTRTGEESMFNIGASAVLGGLWGAALRPHIPARTAQSLETRLNTELHTPDGGTKVLGPEQRAALDTAVPSDHPEVESVLPPTKVAADYEAMRGRATQARKEAFTAYSERMKAVGEQGMSARNFQDEINTARENGNEHDIPEVAQAAKATEQHLYEPVTSETNINPGAESTSGAAAVAKPALEGERLARGAQTLGESFVGKVAPGLRVLKSPSLEARQVIQDLANTPEMLEKNYSGIATPQPVERELWKYDGIHVQALQARAQSFRTYRERMAGSGEPALSRAEFGQQVSAAMRRGDQHEIPEVAQAVKDTRRLVFDPLKERASKLGLLPEDVQATGADSYLTRQYDPTKIRANYGKWLDTLAEGFKAQGVEPGEALDIAHKASRNVLGSERGTMDWHVMDDIVPKSGRLKERTLTLPDTLLEPFLNNDIDHLSHSYMRSLAPEVELTERFGTRDMSEQLDGIKDEYARLTEQAKARGEDPAPLEKQMNNDLRDITAVRDRLYGIYGQPKDPGAWYIRAGRMLRADNVLRLLGAATLAHFPDIANTIMRYGAGNTFSAIGKVLTSMEAMRLTRSESQRMGAAIDMVMNMTSSFLGDYGSHSQFAEQRLMSKVTRGFTIATGETPLVTAVQGLTSTLAGHEILTAAEKVATGGRIAQNKVARLASSGLDEAMLKRIATQGQFTREVNGLRFGMSDQWADEAAARAFESAVLKEAHGVTLRPGAGDTPLLMSGELGKLIMQFKTFAFASQRIVVNPLMQGLAHGDSRAVQGLFALMFMGGASYVAKQTAAGQPVELDKPGKLAMEVLDKSNLMGWTAQFVFPSMWQFGLKDLSRWSDQQPEETLLGPSAGTVFNAYKRQFPAKVTDAVTGQNNAKPFSRADLHFLRRITPGQNIWYLRKGINSLEDAIGNAFDLPGKSNADRAAEQAQKESVQ